MLKFIGIKWALINSGCNYLAPEGRDIYLGAASSTKFIENIELMLTTGTNEALNSGIGFSTLD
ncbi:hypothetical protein, partial [Haliscomenobacter sp.]|uniref:hypothetical protein n=1 Tax=Haliscomenobacter sp. TaxID=2717303 RepID=UPI00359446DF